MKIRNREELIAKQEEYRASLNSQRKQILICAGTGCVAGGSLDIYAKNERHYREQGVEMCSRSGKGSAWRQYWTEKERLSWIL